PAVCGQADCRRDGNAAPGRRTRCGHYRVRGRCHHGCDTHQQRDHQNAPVLARSAGLRPGSRCDTAGGLLMKLWSTFTDPILRQNPVTLQILGICSALAVTTTLAAAVTMSLCLTAVVV